MQRQFSIGRRLVAVRGELVAVGCQLVTFGEVALHIGEALIRIGRGLIRIGRRLIFGGSLLLLGEPGKPPLLLLQPGPVVVPIGTAGSCVRHGCSHPAPSSARETSDGKLDAPPVSHLSRAPPVVRGLATDRPRDQSPAIAPASRGKGADATGGSRKRGGPGDRQLSPEPLEA